eukprot:scaffold189328_cov44-Tisochrysis_lutea.AAC.1
MDEMREAAALSPDDHVKIAKLALEFSSLATACEPLNGRSSYRVVAPHLNYECDVVVSTT